MGGGWPTQAVGVARDMLNSDYADHRLTFQLFAQSPPFAHLAAVYCNFDWDGPLSFVKDAADINDNVMGKGTSSMNDSAISSWFSTDFKTHYKCSSDE
ncbi:MAG: hypothetical protein L3J36_16510 [Rhodobacteraceae bacterium]|nr:hypothetical protein [Paracoccaceae bacterium]